MSTLLQINTSINGDAGHSSQLANRFAGHWLEQHPGGRIVRRDLALEPVPHLDGERFQALITAPEQRSAEQNAVVAYSDALIAELRDADAVAVGLPLYNFGIPSAFKAYFDHIARAGHTFRYTPEGPVGLLADRPVTILAARGGRYAGTPADVQSLYVRQFFAFIGIRDLQFVYAEGLAIDAETRNAALTAAERDLRQLAA